MDGASFLTQDEKRAAAGYGPLGAVAAKFNPHHDEAGRFTFAPDGGAAPNDEPTPTPPFGSPSDPPAEPVSKRRPGPPASPAQEMRLPIVARDARNAVQKTQELDPTWRPPTGLYETAEGEIRHFENVANAARARLAEITRDAIPNTNPSWGVNRLTKELYENGYRLRETTRAPGFFYENAETGEQVRLMERPSQRFRSDSPQKHYNEYYYRYRPSRNVPYGSHITIPDKD
ncbi:MAG: hypothetical protein ABL904_14210 [Hyphomicrobiaceae bacterium]